MPKTGIQNFGSLQYGTGDIASSLSALSLVSFVDFAAEVVGLGLEPPGMPRFFYFESSAFSSELVSSGCLSPLPSSSSSSSSSEGNFLSFGNPF